MDVRHDARRKGLRLPHWRGRLVDAYVDGELSARRSQAFAAHVEHCGTCAEQAADRRRLKTRLGAYRLSSGDVPGPDEKPLRSIASGPGPRGHRGRERPDAVRSLVPAIGLAGGVALIAALVGASWVIGGPAPEEFEAAAVVGDWPAGGTELTAEDLAHLRAAGWNCPDFSTVGLDLVRAEGASVSGVPELTLELVGEDGGAHITERRLSAAAGPAPHPSVAGRNAARTGPAGTDGNESVRSSPSGKTSVLTLQTAVYEIQSSLDKEWTDRIIRRIAVTEHARLAPEEPVDPGAAERIARGMSRLLVVDMER